MSWERQQTPAVFFFSLTSQINSCRIWSFNDCLLLAIWPNLHTPTFDNLHREKAVLQFTDFLSVWWYKQFYKISKSNIIPLLLVSIFTLLFVSLLHFSFFFLFCSFAWIMLSYFDLTKRLIWNTESQPADLHTNFTQELLSRFYICLN